MPPLDQMGKKPMDVEIGFDNFEILKIDDRDFTVEINAYLIVKWKDTRIIIDFAHVSNNNIILLSYCFLIVLRRRKIIYIILMAKNCNIDIRFA